MTKKEYINESIQVKYFYRSGMFYISFWVFLALFFGLCTSITGEFSFVALIIVVTTFLGPFIIYYFKHYFYYKKNYENFEFLDVTFKEVHSGILRGTMYFTIRIDVDGESKKIDTKAIFTAGGINLLKLHFDDYVNRVVKIAYDRNTEEVIVIKPVDELD